MSEKMAITENNQAGFFNESAFSLMERAAEKLATSDMIPAHFRGRGANCIIAIDLARRMNLSPFMVMQNLYIVNGMPSWSSKALIATVNSCGRFSILQFKEEGEKGTDSYGWRAFAKELKSETILYGTLITWAMVKAEGWRDKKGSKWLTMPEQMFKYRAAAFWQRIYAPEASMGMITSEEANDIIDVGSGGYSYTEEQASSSSESTSIDMETGEVLNSELPEYPDQQFDANFPKWESAIRSGKSTAKSMIERISTKWNLSDTQKLFIENIENEVSEVIEGEIEND